MLVDLEAFLGLVPGDQLDLGIGKPFGRQEGQHLITEQMWVHGLRDARLLAVALHDLLNAAGRERSAATGFKEVAIRRRSTSLMPRDTQTDTCRSCRPSLKSCGPTFRTAGAVGCLRAIAISTMR